MPESPSKKWYNNIWLQLFIAYLILSPIGSAIYDHTKNIPFLTIFILKPFNYVWNAIISILTFKISIGFIILFIVGLIGVLFFIDKIFYSKPQSPISKPHTPIAPFENYRRDTFKQWTWVWRYTIWGNNYEIIDLIPVCNKCSYKMLSASYGDSYICPNCDNRFYRYENSYWEEDYKIKAMIAHKIENNLYLPN